MLCGLPSVGRQNCICIKFQRDTHVLLVKFKALLKLKSGDVLGCHLLTFSQNVSSNRQDSQIGESIAGRCTKVKSSVHGVSYMWYTVFCVSRLLTCFLHIQKYLNGFVNSAKPL